MAVGFIGAALWFGAHGAPDTAGVAGSTVAVAAFVIAKPRPVVVPAAFAGVLSGAWVSLLWAEGVPSLAAAAMAIALPTASAWLSVRRSSFAPRMLREEGLMLVLVLAAIIAAAPTVAAGWRSAVALNLHQPGGTHAAVPSWTLALAGSAIGLGGLFTLWRRG